MKRRNVFTLVESSTFLLTVFCSFYPLHASDFAHEYVHVSVIGTYKESWLGTSEKNWIYSGAIVNVVSDTMYIATSMYSTGYMEIGKNSRIGNRDDDYSLVVVYNSGIVLPVEEFAFGQNSGLLYLKVYVADLLTENYDYILLEPIERIDATDEMTVIYFDPGDGRLRKTLEIVNRISSSEPHDVWNFGNRYILENYQFNHNNNGSPIVYYDTEHMQYKLVGVMLLREQNNRIDPIIVQLGSVDEMDHLNWIRVNADCVSVVRELNR